METMPCEPHIVILGAGFGRATSKPALSSPHSTRESNSFVSGCGASDWLVPLRVFEGNRPSSTILVERLTPETLGRLVALYERNGFAQGSVWGVDSVDRGGELGKLLAQRIIPELENKAEPRLSHDNSTNNLFRRYRKMKGTSR
jgi:glucose-6-phosphate isomerase